jgi:phosphoglycolate phosphatase
MATVIFDFDGTIVDSLQVAAEIIYTMTQHKYRLSRNDILALRSKSIKTIAKEFKISPLRLLYMVIRGRKMMKEYIDELEPIPGITDVIKLLHHQGNHLYIASTNSSSNIDKFLKNYHQKNTAQPFFYIGDEVRDIEAAKEAGVKSIAVIWGFSEYEQLLEAKPYAIVKKPEELLEIINKPVTDN